MHGSYLIHLYRHAHLLGERVQLLERFLRSQQLSLQQAAVGAVVDAEQHRRRLPDAVVFGHRVVDPEAEDSDAEKLCGLHDGTLGAVGYLLGRRAVIAHVFEYEDRGQVVLG